jgi:hypothetical protein
MGASDVFALPWYMALTPGPVISPPLTPFLRQTPLTSTVGLPKDSDFVLSPLWQLCL